MNKHSILYAFLMVIAIGLGSCRADIDLQDIDKRAELDLGIAMPIGKMSATLGDFLGTGQVPGIYVGFDGPDDPMLYFKDTFHITRTYHNVNLKEKISRVDKKFDVYKELQRQNKLDPNGYVKDEETGKRITLEFPFDLTLEKINNNERDERLDSALIVNASFTSNVGRENLPLPAEWIDEIQIVLGNEFKPKGGKTITVCKKGDFQYLKPIPITVEDFVLNLMKRTNLNYPDEYTNNNVKKECHLQINFIFTIPNGTKVQIPSSARYDYNLEVQFIDFAAIWGYFQPSSDMRDKDVLVIEEEWPKWHDLKKATLPFTDPVVHMYVRSKVAGAMVMHGRYLYAKSDTKNDSVYANFSPDPNILDSTRQEDFKEGIFADGMYRNGYLPFSSQIGDSTKMCVDFDKTAQGGRIDKLFEIRPDKLGYRFFIDFNTQKTPQIRVLPNTALKIEAEVIAPFRFNQGLEASYVDTLSDISISEASLDSLAYNSDVIDTIKTANLKLLIAIENRIPLRMKGVMRFLDEYGNTIMDPSNPKEPLRIAKMDSLLKDTILINAPELNVANGYPYPIKEPINTTTYTIDIDREHYNTFTSMKQMIFYVELDAAQMSQYYKDPRYHVELTADDKLTVKLGITAQAEAVFNFNDKNNDKK